MNHEWIYLSDDGRYLREAEARLYGRNGVLPLYIILWEPRRLLPLDVDFWREGGLEVEARRVRLEPLRVRPSRLPHSFLEALLRNAGYSDPRPWQAAGR